VEDQETFRFITQSYNLEDVRVMKYQRLKNLVILVTAEAYFAATFPGQQMELRILCEKLLIISQRFFGIHPSGSMTRPLEFAESCHRLRSLRRKRRQPAYSWTYPSG
jgi:hypothetical protein